MKIALSTFVVRNYDEAIDFFVNKVGFELTEDSPATSTMTGEPKRWVVVTPPGAKSGMLLAEASNDDQTNALGNQTGGRVAWFLETDDFDRQHQRMLDAGITFVGEPRTEPYGRVVVWDDLYGNRWDLIEGEDTQPRFGDSESVPAPFPVPSDVGEILITEAEIRERVEHLGAQITADYSGRTPLLVAVLKGSVVFVADLMRAIHGPVEFDCLAVSSYGAATKSSGVVRIIKDLDNVISGRDVILVEDIIDSGLTLRFLLDHLGAQRPASLRTCSLVVRQGSQVADLTVDYKGFELPPAFVVGYGLDAGQKYRNLPYIARYTGA